MTKALVLSFMLLIICAAHKSTGQVKQKGSTILKTGWYYVVNSRSGVKRQLDKSKEHYFIDKHPIVTANNFTNLLLDGSTYSYGPEYQYRLVMQLDLAGAKLMGMATKKSIGKKLAFILNDKLLNVVGVMAMVDNGMTVMDRGTYTKEELEKFKAAVYQGMPLR
jgi:preprotein translocase subunit SecD